MFTTIVALALTTTIAGAAIAGPSASIEQVRNGQATATSTPTPAWVSGNAGASNSHYLESHSIPYRAVMDQLPTDGTVVELVIGYNVKRSGSYALDYLTQFQRVLPHVLFGHQGPEVFDPLSGVTGVGSTITTAPIPLTTQNLMVDPDGTDPEPAALQPWTNMASLPAAERVMTLYGGTLIDVTYVSEANVNFATSSSETQVKVRFTANSAKAVLAWGGHIACRWDWGFNADGTPRSAGGISGSSYHMRLVSWNFGSLGNQDRSMSTDAVYPVPKCGISNLGPLCAWYTNIHTAPSGMETYEWSLLDNTSGASIVGSNTGLSVTVNAGSAGSYRIVLTTGASGFTKQCDAVVSVNAPVSANAGADMAACASSPQVQLAGVVTGGTGTWSGGAGTYSPNANDPNAIYTPTAAEITAGGVTLTLTCRPPSGPCPPASDQVMITYNRAATANAGADLIVCATSPQAQLAGVVGGGTTGGSWSGGAGTFTPGASALNAIYTPSADEIAAGSVTLTLTTNDPHGPCAAISDQVKITINPPATVNAGADQTVCATSPRAQLAGVVGGGAASGTWSGGTGSYSPNASAANAAYTPSAAEIAAGGVTLTFTTNDPSGPCGAVSDQVRITINPAATANAGADQTVCSSSPQVQLAGAIGGGATSGFWSGGAGTFSPGRTSLSATYTPSGAEIAAGSVTLSLATNDPAGPCPAVSDPITITINPAATVNAGADQRVCASSPQVQLAGVVGGGASGGTWSGGAGLFKPNASSLGATYTPTAAEIASGSVTLTLTTNDPAGPCPALSDAMKITIDPITIVNAGADQTVCSSSPQVQLHGSVSGSVTSGTWSGGAGTFSPSATGLNATYTPSPAEIAAGGVTLTLTSAASSGPCPPASDQVRITISPAATVLAGADLIVCAASPTVRLAGTIGGAATTGTWSGGMGTYNPNETTWNALYTPTPSEIAAGSVTLTFTTNDPAGPCPAVNDQVKITFDRPTVTVPDKYICTGITPVSLCANATGVAPFTYRWSNGATTQCISVSDTGSYSVTITDSKGCQASGSGGFHWRDCTGMLAHTITTCQSYMDGTGSPLLSSDVHWVLRDGIISSVSPGVFFYYTLVKAPSSSFAIEISQTKSNPAFPFLPVLQSQVSLFDQNCSNSTSGVELTTGQASVAVTGATTGQVFIACVKYSLKALVGVPMGPTDGSCYTFRTMVNGQVVDADPDGLIVGNVLACGSDPGGGSGGTSGGSGGTGGNGAGDDAGDIPGVDDDPGVMLPQRKSVAGNAERVSEAYSLEAYRPVPNPFRDDMRMVYMVNSGGTRVSVRVFDVAGRMVRTLVDGFQPAGRHLATWDGRNESGSRMTSGMYFVHVRIGTEAKQVRVTVLQ